MTGRKHVGIHFNGSFGEGAYIGGTVRLARITNCLLSYSELIVLILETCDGELGGSDMKFFELVKFKDSTYPVEIKTDDDTNSLLTSFDSPEIYVICQSNKCHVPAEGKKLCLENLVASDKGVENKDIPQLGPHVDDVQVVSRSVPVGKKICLVDLLAAMGDSRYPSAMNAENLTIRDEQETQIRPSRSDSSSDGSHSVDESHSDDSLVSGNNSDGSGQENSSSEVDTNPTVNPWTLPFSIPSVQSLEENSGDDLLSHPPYKKPTPGLLIEQDIYTTRMELLVFVAIHHLKRKVGFHVNRSSTDRLSLKCSDVGCKFVLNATGRSGFWRTTRVIFHSCDVDITRNAPPKIPSKLIGAIYAGKQRERTKPFSPKDIMEDMHSKYGMDILYPHAYRSKTKMNENLFGKHDESFKMIPTYLYLLLNANPGTYSAQDREPNGQFKHVFFALGASIKGFKNFARPVIVVDGAHLKGKFNGIAFVAVTQDANRQIFPLATGIGSVESSDSWKWFLTKLKEAYGEPSGLLIVSDQHKGLTISVPQVFSNSSHGLCYQHLKKQVKPYGASITACFKRALYAYIPSEFERLLSCIANSQNGLPVANACEANKKYWSRVHCPVRRYEFMTSNAAESWNRRILCARDKPIVMVLESIRCIHQEWFQVRRVAASQNKSVLSAHVTRKLAEGRKLSDRFVVEPLANGNFKIIDGLSTNMVDLYRRTCDCYEFQGLGIPCTHAQTAIRHMNYPVANYVEECYTNASVMGMWKEPVMPVPEPKDWVVPDSIVLPIVIPPECPRQAGRPRKKRKRSHSEPAPPRHRRKNRCSRCNGLGHNRSSCHVHVPALVPAFDEGEFPEASSGGLDAQNNVNVHHVVATAIHAELVLMHLIRDFVQRCSISHYLCK